MIEKEKFLFDCVNKVLERLSTLTPLNSIKVGSKTKLVKNLHTQLDDKYSFEEISKVVNELLPNYPKLSFD